VFWVIWAVLGGLIIGYGCISCFCWFLIVFEGCLFCLYGLDGGVFGAFMCMHDVFSGAYLVIAKFLFSACQLIFPGVEKVICLGDCSDVPLYFIPLHKRAPVEMTRFFCVTVIDFFSLRWCNRHYGWC
jgi:hypothetical protein